MNIYGIYDTENNEQCMRVETLKEMSIAVNKNRTIRQHYKVYYLFKEEVH